MTIRQQMKARGFVANETGGGLQAYQGEVKGRIISITDGEADLPTRLTGNAMVMLMDDNEEVVAAKVYGVKDFLALDINLVVDHLLALEAGELVEGQIVKFRDPIEGEDDPDDRYLLVELRGDRVLIQWQNSGMSISPTSVVPLKDIMYHKEENNL